MWLRSQIDCTTILIKWHRWRHQSNYLPITEKRSHFVLSTSDSRVRFWHVMVNGAQSRSKLRRISKAKSSIRSCIGHKYVYVYELGCRIVALKSWYPCFQCDTPETPETTFMNATATESPRRVHSSRPTMTRLGTRVNIRLDPDKVSHRKIPWSLEAARFVFKIVPSQIWEAPRQQCKRRDNINLSRGFETSRYLTVRVVVSILTGPGRARS